MENRNGIAVGGCVTQATGTAEREAALALIEEIPRRMRITLGGDKGYDVPDFVKGLKFESGQVDDEVPHLHHPSATA